MGICLSWLLVCTWSGLVVRQMTPLAMRGLGAPSFHLFSCQISYAYSIFSPFYNLDAQFCILLLASTYSLQVLKTTCIFLITH